MHRATYQKALCQVAFATAQEFQLRYRFYAFGCYLNVETAGHGNRSTNYSLVAAVHFDILDQRLIENKTVNHAGIKGAEGNIVSAEMVQ